MLLRNIGPLDESVITPKYNSSIMTAEALQVTFATCFEVGTKLCTPHLPSGHGGDYFRVQNFLKHIF